MKGSAMNTLADTHPLVYRFRVWAAAFLLRVSYHVQGERIRRLDREQFGE